jgi:hypothetical protein
VSGGQPWLGGSSYTSALASRGRHRHTDTRHKTHRNTDPLDAQTIHLVNHRVLVHEIFVKFLASDLSLKIGDEVLDVCHGATLLIDACEEVHRRVVERQESLQVLLAHIENLEEGVEFLNKSRHGRSALVHAGLGLPREAPTFEVQPRNTNASISCLYSPSGMLCAFSNRISWILTSRTVGPVLGGVGGPSPVRSRNRRCMSTTCAYTPARHSALLVV